MKRLWLAGLALGFVLPNVATQIAAEQEAKDPVYMGKSLSEWIKELKDQDKAVRSKAVKVVGRMRPDEAKSTVPALVDVLKDEDPMVRFATAFALMRIGPPAKEARANTFIA